MRNDGLALTAARDLLKLKSSTTLGKVVGFKCGTDQAGINKLLDRLRHDDIVGIEAGYPAFTIARQIIDRLGSNVIVLNPGKLAVIYASLKKTDKEDHKSWSV